MEKNIQNHINPQLLCTILLFLNVADEHHQLRPPAAERPAGNQRHRPRYRQRAGSGQVPA